MSSATFTLRASDFSLLFHALQHAGYRIIGPKAKDQVIVFDEVQSAEELPRGWSDEQSAGHYRLNHSSSPAYFGYVQSPQSWKKYLFPARLKLWSTSLGKKSFAPHEESIPDTRFAFLGIRPCDLNAIQIQDRVFTQAPHPDPYYLTHRKNALLIVTQCTRSVSTCFCTSMQTGPRAEKGFDLALTEIIEGEHRFFIEAHSEAGHQIIQALQPRLQPVPQDQEIANQLTQRTANQIQKKLKTDGLREKLKQNLEHPLWKEVAERCLSCTNCTMVCPTCFCSTVEDTTDLARTTATRTRRWDSCFSNEHSYIHGGSIRTSTASKYRQWLTHKLAHWHDQFGTSGCVGCGRCITWCPPGIDLTVEMDRLWKTSND